MKKLVMFLSLAILLGVVTANAQDKKPEVKKATSKTTAAKPAATTPKPASTASKSGAKVGADKPPDAKPASITAKSGAKVAADKAPDTKKK